MLSLVYLAVVDVFIIIIIFDLVVNYGCFLWLSQSQVWEGKATEEKKKENTKVEPKSQKPSEVPAGLNKESLPAAPTNGEVKLTENGSVTKGDDMKGAKSVTVAEKKPVAKGIAKGVANGC